jgi:hypothetical protein
MDTKRPRRWKFEAYQQEQRADLLAGLPPVTSNVVVAWGNGSFGPTSRGHDSAPNKILRKRLSQYVPIVLFDEYNTSKRSCCCRSSKLTSLRSTEKKKRTTVFRCDDCNTLLSRSQ